MAKVKRLRAESNGNRTFISDFVGTAEALAQTIDGLGIIKDFVLTRVLTGVNTAVNLTISDRGGVIMRNKFFGVRGGDNLVVPKGIYLYAIGEYDTTEPRTTTTGAQYYQNYIYYLDTSDTPKTGLSTDYSALTGVWEIINGAKTSAMTISEYQKFYMSLAVMWDWDQINMPLPNNSVGPDQIQDISVSTRKIADSAVTTLKVADGAITGPKLASGLMPGTFRIITDTALTSPISLVPWNYLIMERDSNNRPTNITINLTNPSGTLSGNIIKMVIGNAGATQFKVYVDTLTAASPILFTVDQDDVVYIEAVYVMGQWRLHYTRTPNTIIGAL